MQDILQLWEEEEEDDDNLLTNPRVKKVAFSGCWVI